MRWVMRRSVPHTMQHLPATAARCASVARIDGVRCSEELRRSRRFSARQLGAPAKRCPLHPFLLSSFTRRSARRRRERPPGSARRTTSYVTTVPRPGRPRQLAAAGPHRPHGATDAFLGTPDALLSVLTSAHRILTSMHPGYCPQCGERVTPYAAGCALCGADLDPKRWQKPVSVRQTLSVRMPAGLRRAIRGRGAVRVRGSL